ncbi:MAG TPA: periplasmic heavy metal sensor [Candidatus Methylomirabilis sp.]|nr:periplasmic heavy metal sensor [Candidatus Methylomirabilis sp.]
MRTRMLIAILAGGALVMGTWAWAQRDAAAQQQMRPGGQGMMGSGGMMGGQGLQGGTSTGPGTMGPQGSGGQGMMGGQTQQGRQGGGPGTVGPRHRPGTTRGARGTGWGMGFSERPLISEMLSLQEQLALSPAQVQRLQGLRSRFEKDGIRQQAEIQAAEVDLSDLQAASPPDLGKIEAQVAKIATLTGKLRFARIKTLEEGRAVLSQEQWQKFQAMAPGMGPRGPYGGQGQQGQAGPGQYGPYGMMGGYGPGMMGGYGPGGYGPGSMMQGYGAPGMMGMMGPGMMGGFGGPGGMMGGYGPFGGYEQRQFTSNGERIYFTGFSRNDGYIPRVGGPPWAQRVGCVACHGPSGRGGVPVMMGTAIPEDIRYAALTAPAPKKEEPTAKGEKEEQEHPPFTDATIGRAITQGLDESGQPLDWTMPRWQMAEQDLNDVITYLKTLR